MERVVLTIGHSTHTFARFCELLVAQGVTTVADVRSTPYSVRNPHFNREALSIELKKQSIGYLYLGGELGGRPSDPSFYREGRVQYRRLEASGFFRAGLNRIRSGLENQRIALMCSEGDPLQCHRFVLVSRNLKDPDTRIQHILPTGSVESQQEAEIRLLKIHKLSQVDIFSQTEDLVDRAYQLQEVRIAYAQREEQVVGAPRNLV